MLYSKDRNIVRQHIDAKDIKIPPLKTAALQTDLIAANDTSVVSDVNHTINPEDLQLLQHLWASTDLQHQIAILDRKTDRFSNIPVQNINDALEQVNKSDDHLDFYFACAEYKTADNRKADNVEGARGVWLDFDCGEDKDTDNKGYLTKEMVQAAINSFCIKFKLDKPTHIVDSGNGLHVYWLFDNIVYREKWQKAAKKLKALTIADNLKVDGSRTADIASVLRIPGTMNNKSTTPKPVRLIYANDDLINAETMLQAIDDAYNTAVSQKPTINKNTTKADSTQSEAPDLKRLKSALKALSPDCEEDIWKLRRLAPMAKAAAEHPEIADQMRELAGDWSSGELAGSPSVAWSTAGKNGGLKGEAAFEIEWNRFTKSNYAGNATTLNTIYYDAMEVGWNAPKEEFTAVNDDVIKADGDEPLDALQMIQKQYGLLNLQGKLYTFDQYRLETTAGQPAQKLELSGQSDATLLLKRAIKAKFPNSEDRKIAAEFFVSPETTYYEGVEFNPKSNNKNYLNLWVGPYRKAKKGNKQLILAFLFNVICDGDENSYNYLINYIAHALQKPEEKPGVMIILMGGQGIGKGTLGRIIQKIWPSTYLQVSNIDAITGNFNGALERSYFVFMDEALFAGDRKSSDALKSLVTEPLILINEKHQPARQTKSYHRFIAATNAMHLKHTDNDDRRDFVLQVSERHKNDHNYWNELDHEMNHGGIEAFMYDLQERDLTNFNVRAKPSTAALMEQKLMSLGPIERWWHNCLEYGEVEVISEHGNIIMSGQWTDFHETSSLVKYVMEFSGGKLFRKPTPKDIVSTLTKICPSITKGQETTGGFRRRGLWVPKLHIAREEFEAYIGGKVSWFRFNG
jgi:hypothetical protein